MAASTIRRPKPVSKAQLKREGFSSAQIERLTILRGSYPMPEFVDSSSQFRKLEFLKWLYDTGKMSDDIDFDA
ncbi:MAG: hypothetical protein ACRD1H_14515 [Vicinamibacterales bacterium]